MGCRYREWSGVVLSLSATRQNTRKVVRHEELGKWGISKPVCFLCTDTLQQTASLLFLDGRYPEIFNGY